MSAGSGIQWWPEDKPCPGELRAHLPPDYELLGVTGHTPDPWQDHILEEGPTALSQPLTRRSVLQSAGINSLAYRPQTAGPPSGLSQHRSSFQTPTSLLGMVLTGGFRLSRSGFCIPSSSQGMLPRLLLGTTREGWWSKPQSGNLTDALGRVRAPPPMDMGTAGASALKITLATGIWGWG